jgi:hypothetical protein
MDWNFANVVADIRLNLPAFPVWKGVKISRCANFHAHSLAKWVASYLVFGSIPN